MNDAECSRNVVNGRKLACATKSMVNAKGLPLECVRILYQSTLFSVLMDSSELRC